MGFRSNGIETTSSWSLWKTTTEFIEKARRAAVVDGKLPRSASLGRDRQTQAEIQPSTTTPRSRSTQTQAHFQPSQRGTERRAEKETKKSMENRGESRKGKRNKEREKNRAKKKKKNLNRRVRNTF
jgi:hypothetical protein